VNAVFTDVVAIASLLLPAQPDAVRYTGFDDEKQHFVRLRNANRLEDQRRSSAP
jgi:hypothetical protein